MVYQRRRRGQNLGAGKLKRAGWRVLVHSLRTAVVAVASLLVARLFRLPASYWAPITTLVVTQSSLGAALAVSWQRFIGTILGAVVGGLVASFFPSNALIFGACVFILGLLCALTRFRLSRLPLRRHDGGHRALDPADGTGMANCFPPLCGGVHRPWGRTDLCVGVAGA